MPDRPNADLPDRERPDRADPEELRDWETVQDNGLEKTQRLMLIHGWLYRTITPTAVGLVFVPEPRGDQ